MALDKKERPSLTYCSKGFCIGNSFPYSLSLNLILLLFTTVAFWENTKVGLSFGVNFGVDGILGLRFEGFLVTVDALLGICWVSGHKRIEKTVIKQ